MGFWTKYQFCDIISGVAIKGRRATYEERVSACEALENGIPADEVAKVLKVSRASVFEWQKTYRAHGAKALRTKKTRGPKSKLDDGQMSQLYLAVASSNAVVLTRASRPAVATSR